MHFRRPDFDVSSCRAFLEHDLPGRIGGYYYRSLPYSGPRHIRVVRWMIECSGVARSFKRGKKLRKSSKESGKFQSVSNICSFLMKDKVKSGRGAWHNATLNALLIKYVISAISVSLFFSALDLCRAEYSFCTK